MLASYYYEQTKEAWIFFLLVFSIISAIFGIVLARKRAVALLNQSYLPVTNDV